MMIVNKPICILGGTFDPVHNWHIHISLEVVKLFDLEKIHVVPCKLPVHKHSQATTEQRLEMLKLSIADHPQLIIDTREIDRKTPSYMVPTLESYRIEYPDNPLCLIVGLDSFLALDTWHEWEKILELSHLLVAPRIGYELPKTGIIAKLFEQRSSSSVGKLKEDTNGRIMMLDIPPTDLSSTAIRNKIAKNEDVTGSLPKSVNEYIVNSGLYQEKI